MPGAAGAYFSGLMATGYFLPFLAGAQTICGFLLLIGAYVPLALVALAPIILHITLFHLFLDQKGLPMAIFLFVLETYLAFFAEPYCAKIKPLFTRS